MAYVLFVSFEFGDFFGESGDVFVVSVGNVAQIDCFVGFAHVFESFEL